MPTDSDFVSFEQGQPERQLRGIAGERGRLVLQPRDETGALLPLREGGKTLTARLLHNQSGVSAEVSTRNAADRKLEVHYVATVAGRYRLWLKCARHLVCVASSV